LAETVKKGPPIDKRVSHTRREPIKFIQLFQRLLGKYEDKGETGRGVANARVPHCFGSLHSGSGQRP